MVAEWKQLRRVESSHAHIRTYVSVLSNTSGMQWTCGHHILYVVHKQYTDGWITSKELVTIRLCVQRCGNERSEHQ